MKKEAKAREVEVGEKGREEGGEEKGKGSGFKEGRREERGLATELLAVEGYVQRAQETRGSACFSLMGSFYNF